MGGARVALATAPSGKAIEAILGGVGTNGQLLIIAAPGNVRPLVETYPLDRAKEAYERMMSGQVRFRAVVQPHL
jgi:D-arabinose 1-dehydrogenase-like Zn-dependent alcohol dehydrogenase